MNQALPMVYLVRHADTAWTLTGQHAGRTDLPLTELAMPHAHVDAEDDLMEWDYGTYEGRRTTEIEIDRPGWRLFRDGCPGGETFDSVATRTDRVIDRIRTDGVTVLLFGHREVLRIVAARWIGLAPIEGRRLLLATAFLERPWVRPRPYRACHPRLEWPLTAAARAQ